MHRITFGPAVNTISFYCVAVIVGAMPRVYAIAGGCAKRACLFGREVPAAAGCDFPHDQVGAHTSASELSVVGGP